MGGSWGHPIFALSGKVLGKINRRLHIVSSQQFSSLSQFLSRNYIKATSTDSHIDLEFASRFFLLALVSRWEYCKYFFFEETREKEKSDAKISASCISFSRYITTLTTACKRVRKENTGQIRGVDYRCNHTAGFRIFLLLGVLYQNGDSLHCYNSKFMRFQTTITRLRLSHFCPIRSGMEWLFCHFYLAYTFCNTYKSPTWYIYNIHLRLNIWQLFITPPSKLFHTCLALC